MVVQHNLTAINSNRQLRITNRTLAGATEKLSSGYKINKAADDAAGLSISEKMRKQIRGLTKAVENSEDGISLVQVADGAMNEVHDMIDRCYELSIKAANGTMSEQDRRAVQDEIDAILTEIDAIRDKTKFNEVYVLKGEVETPGVAESEDGLITIGEELPDWINFGSALDDGFLTEDYVTKADFYPDESDQSVVQEGDVHHPAATIDFSGLTADNAKDLIGTGFHTTCCTCSDYYSIEFVKGSQNSSHQSGTNFVYRVGVDNITTGEELIEKIIEAVGNDGIPNNHFTRLVKDETNVNTLVLYDMRQTADDATFNTPKDYPTGWDSAKSKWVEYDTMPNYHIRYNAKPGPNGTFGKGVTYDAEDPALGIVNIKDRKQLSIHSGSEADMTNKVVIHLPAISCRVLGLTKVTVMTEDDATASIRKFEKAKAFVSAERSRMGAYQNRLEHTVKNLGNIIENTQASESQLRDTDMAKQMVAYSNLSVLAQAGQSMLAQSNQSNQGVLSLIA